MTEPFRGAAPSSLRAIAAAFRSGQLGRDAMPFSITRVVGANNELAAEVGALLAGGLAPSHLALLLDACADRADAAAGRVSAELVWTGPSGPGAHSRDTAVVVEELIAQARADLLLSTFVVQEVPRVFRTLAGRLDADPAFRARLFLHVARGWRDTSVESEVLREFADELRRDWPGQRPPEVYYDPRGLSPDSGARATWHAKCVVADDDKALVTSANFTEWAQQRNVEAGVLVTSREFVRQLRRQFDSLVEAQAVRRLPGW